MFNIEEELKKLPARPGCYIMHNAQDEIIYVGKAISLRNRVRQYFQKSTPHTAKITRMVENVAWFEYIVTDSEVEALVLENNLIKEHHPKYNTMLKDDKTYPYIKVTVQEHFPRVMMTRKILRDGAKYYGPYPTYIRDMIDLMNRMYGFRTCNKKFPRDLKKERACLNYQIGRCQAPCQGFISEEDYDANIREIMTFLDGKYEPMLKKIEERMKDAAEKMNFEDAASYRDMMGTVKRMMEQQKINTSDLSDDRDVLALARADSEAVMQVFFIRDGKIIGRDHFELEDVGEETKGEIFSEFIKQYYAGTPYIPKELMCQYEVDDAETIESWLTVRRGSHVKIVVPKRGDKHKLIELAYRNASIVLNQDSERNKREHARTLGAVHELAQILSLGEIHRIESYDISNTSGYENVGSMVVYEDGKPKRNDYRKFRIRSFQGADDYRSMDEVLTRRFRHGIEETEKVKASAGAARLSSFSSFPDLILMDGGKGQVNVCLQVLNKLDLHIPVAGLVKDDHHRTRGIYYNNVELPIDTSGEMFKLITRIQDETHRFAITYHKLLRGKAQVKSILDDIPQIGPRRRLALMKHFVSLEAIREADVDTLAAVESMDRRSAQAVYDFFRQADADPAEGTDEVIEEFGEES